MAPEGERRQRPRFRWARFFAIGGWLVVACATLFWAEGPFWRTALDWVERAQGAAARGEWSLALSHLQRAIEQSPESAGLRTFEGYAFQRVGRPDEAEASFRAALGSEPSDVEAALGLAEVLLGQGDTTSALGALSGAAVGAGDTARLTRKAGLAEAAGDHELALLSLERIPTPGNRRARIRLAMATGAWERAASLLEEDLSEAPTPAARRAYAFALERSGRVRDAEAQYRRLAELGDLDEEAVIRYAWLLNEQRRHDEALAVLEGRSLGPEGAFVRAQSALWAGRLALARAEASSLPPDDPRARDIMARLVEEERLASESAAREAALAAASRPPDDPARALSFWLERLRSQPSDSVALREALALYESMQRFEEALELVLARGEPATLGEDQAIRAARLAWWANRPAVTIASLERAQELRRPAGLPFSEEILLIEALLATERSGEALSRSERLTETSPADARVVLLAARSAQAAERPAATRRHLTTLGGLRPLTTSEAHWLAGLQRQAGELAAALVQYDRIRAADASDREAHLGAADIRLATGDYQGAEQAYRQAGLAPADPTRPRLALAIARQGRSEEAVRVYREYLDLAPEDHDARLSLARLLASENDPVAASEYARYVRDTGDDAVALEVAQLLLSVEDFSGAEPWARTAVAESNDWGARLALAQAVLFQGKLGEAQDMLDLLAEREIEGLAGASWRARIARLRQRPLYGQRVLAAAVSGPEADRAGPEHWLLLAELAVDRGDLGRAHRVIEQAAAAGATEQLSELDRDLRARLRPRIEGGGEAGSDRAELDVRSAWVGVDLSPASGALRANAEVRRSTLAQTGTSRETTSVRFSADSIFTSDADQVRSSVTLHASDGGPTTLAGLLGGRRDFENGSSIDLVASHEPIWAGTEGPDPLRHLRVRDLGGLDLGLAESGVRFGSTLALGIMEHARVEVGASRYTDGNVRLLVYGHLQRPLRVTRRSWIVVAPNLYAESFSSNAAAYISPGHYLSLGVRGQGASATSWGSVSGWVNPHVFRYPGRTGVGFDTTVNLTIGLGRQSLLVGAYYLHQRSTHELFRMNLGIRVPLGAE